MNMLLICLIVGFLKAPMVSVRTAKEEGCPVDWQLSGEMKVGKLYLAGEVERENNERYSGYEIKTDPQWKMVKFVGYTRLQSAKDINVQKFSIEPTYTKAFSKVNVRVSAGGMMRAEDYDIGTKEYGISGRGEVSYNPAEKTREGFINRMVAFVVKQWVDLSARGSIEGSIGFNGSRDIKVKVGTDVKFTTLFGLSFMGCYENFDGKDNFQVKFSPMIVW